MINQLKRIKNFKNIANLNYLDLSRITLLGGKNNTGKTNILEAIFLFHDRLNAEMLFRLYQFRGVVGFELDPQAIFAPIFYNFNMEQNIEITLVRNSLSEELKLKSNPNFLSQNVANPFISGIRDFKLDSSQNAIPSFALDIEFEMSGKNRELSHLFINSTGMGLNVESMRPNIVSAVFLASRVRINPQEDAARYGKLDMVGRQDDIIEFIRIIEPRLKSFSVISQGNSSMIYADIGLDRKIPINIMGDGVSRLLSIALAIATNENGLVLIDEIDNGIHYSTLPQIWKVINAISRKFNCQIIATTHSYECIQAVVEGLKENDSNDFKYIRLERNNDNNLLTKVFDYNILSKAIEQNWEVR